MADLPLPDPLIQHRGTFATIIGYSTDQMHSHAAAVSAADNAALRAELERLTRELAEEMEHTALLRTERDALREDAERYRYLRDGAWHSGSLIFYAERYGPEDWDEAIDAARKDTP